VRTTSSRAEMRLIVDHHLYCAGADAGLRAKAAK
jgi:hypothetical protein